MLGREESPDATTNVDTRGKAARLFSYLRELAKLRLSMVRDCRDYEEILWFHEIPIEPECASIARSLAPDDSETWVRIERVDEPACPEPPQACSEWVDAASLNDSSGVPRLRDEILKPNVNPDEPPVIHSLSDHPDIQRVWESFVRDKWDTWAKEHRRWQTIQLVYDRLFLMYQTLKKSGETFEVVLGASQRNYRPDGQRAGARQ